MSIKHKLLAKNTKICRGNYLYLQIKILFYYFVLLDNEYPLILTKSE